MLQVRVDMAKLHVSETLVSVSRRLFVFPELDAVAKQASLIKQTLHQTSTVTNINVNRMKPLSVFSLNCGVHGRGQVMSRIFPTKQVTLSVVRFAIETSAWTRWVRVTQAFVVALRRRMIVISRRESIC